MLKWLVGTLVAFALSFVAFAAAAQADPPKTCPQAVTGQIDPAPIDPKQTGRITQGFPASVCGAPARIPSVTPGAFGYEAHTFKNRTEQTCMRVTLTLTSPGGELSAAAYTAFDAANVAAGFAGGTSNAVRAGDVTKSFAFDAAPLSDFVVVVSEATDGVGGAYRLDVAGCGDVLVRSVEPNYGPSRGGTAVTVRGAGFRSDAKVTFGGVAASDVTVDDEFTLRATTPAYAGGGASPHAVDVAVTNGDATTSTKAGAFTYYDPQPTNLTLKADAVPSRFGQMVTFTAHAGPDTPQLATGTVEFLRDGEVFGSAQLDAAGNATGAISNLAVGAHAIVARYGGDDYHAAGEATLNHEVIRSDSATNLVSAANPTTPDEPIAVTATVGPQAPGAGSPTGSVTFRLDGTVVGTVDLDADGRAQFTAGVKPAGEYTLTASFSGDGSFNASTSEAVVQKVRYTQIRVALAARPGESSTFGTQVSFEATITVVGGAKPNGTVKFEDVTATPAVLLGTGTVDANGKASLNTTSLAAGVRSIRATFADPSGAFETGSKTISYRVVKATTTVTLTSSKNPQTPGTWVTITAKVTSSVAGVPVRGNVEFRQNGAMLGTVAIGANGTAAIDSTRLAAGTYTLTAEYKGNDSFTGSSASILQRAGSGVPDAGPGGSDGGKRDAGRGYPVEPIYVTSSDDGCGCHSAGAPASGLASIASAIGFALLLARRRRR